MTKHTLKSCRSAVGLVTKHTPKTCRSPVGLVAKHTIKSWSCGKTHDEELVLWRNTRRRAVKSAVGLAAKHTMKSWAYGKAHAEELSECWALIAGWIILLLSCSSTVAFPDTVFVVLLRTAISEVHKLLRTGGVGVS